MNKCITLYFDNTENMPVLKTYKEDLPIAQAILNRDGKVTRDFMYRKCYPLFKSVFDNYFTDSADVHEFIDEIYLQVLTPSKETGHCQLENYRGESSLATWFKSVCLFHCYHRYERRKRMPMVEIAVSDSDNDDGSDRFLDRSCSTPIDTASLDRQDLETVISMMPNERYRNIIRLRYLERMTNEETAEELSMTMANYYNKHKLAKEQFVNTLRKESCNV